VNQIQTLQDHLLDFLHITEKGALACYPLIGQGQSQAADQVAVDTMRSQFQKLNMDVQIVIGEGERDKAPRLYTGERLGKSDSDFKIDVAVDPLEGTSICAEGRQGALSVMAVSLRGKLFKAPDIYMKKLACGPKAKGAINLKASVKENIRAVSDALQKKPQELEVGVLKRERHQDLIAALRKEQVKIRLVGDGDVALALETSLESSSLDLLMGIGGAPEGVLAAAALKSVGGDFQAQLVYNNEEEKQNVKTCGITDLHKIWTTEELVLGDVLFFATAVTTASFLSGIHRLPVGFQTHSLVLGTQIQREIKTIHKH